MNDLSLKGSYLISLYYIFLGMQFFISDNEKEFAALARYS